MMKKCQEVDKVMGDAMAKLWWLLSVESEK